MDRKRIYANIGFGIFFKTLVLLLSIFVKRYIIINLGIEVNGLYALYSSILGFLTIANLGVGTAITYSMYKPIVDKDKDSISALYYLYRKFYTLTFIIILVLGILLIPIIPTIAKGNTDIKSIYITFFIFLLSVSLTYLFAHQTSLINAYKDNYITTLITSITLIIEGIIQIIILINTKSFLLFLLVKVLSTIVQGLVTKVIFTIKYKDRINNNKLLNLDIKNEVWKNAKAKMYYEIGVKLISTFDGIIISFFIGVITLGQYSNYIEIAGAMYVLLNLIFTEVTSIVGHNKFKQTQESFFLHFKIAYLINYLIGIIFFLGYVAVSNDLIRLLFGDIFVIDDYISIIIAVDFFVNYMRRSLSLFKNATGVFYKDRHRPLIEGGVNIVLSILLVKRIGLHGVLIGTIFTRLLISYTIEPYMLFKHSFQKPVKKFLIIHYISVTTFLISILVYKLIPFSKNIENIYISILAKGLISFMVSTFVFLILFISNKNFRKLFNLIIRNDLL